MKFFKRKKRLSDQDKADMEITDFLGQQELVRLTPGTLDDLTSIIEQFHNKEFVPVKTYKTDNGYCATVKSTGRISSWRKQEFSPESSQNYLEVNSGSDLPSIFYYNSDHAQTHYSAFTVQGKLCGLYLRRQGTFNSHQLFLDTSYCRKELPAVFKLFEERNAYEERMNSYRNRANEPLQSSSQADDYNDHETDDDIDIPVFVGGLAAPILVSRYGIRPLGWPKIRK